jgi:prevent-host-death family protein
MSAALSISMPTQPFQLGSTLGAFDAKTHFSRILEMVSKGKEFIVTKHGKAVAKISPMIDTTQIDHEALIASRRAVIARMKASRIKLAPDQTIEGLIAEGRRW